MLQTKQDTKPVTILKDFANAVNGINDMHTKTRCLKTMAGYAYKKKNFLDEVEDLAAGIAHADIKHENQDLHYQTQIRLSENPSFQNNVYMGAAGLLNLGYIAKSKAAGAILYDANPVQAVFWDVLLGLIKKNRKRADFMCALKTFPDLFHQRLKALNKEALSQGLEPLIEEKVLENDPQRLIRGMPDDPFIDYLFNDETKPQNTIRLTLYGLHSDEDYEHLHKMVSNNAIARVILDVKDNDTWDQIHSAVTAFNQSAKSQDNEAHIGVIYTSNIFGFLPRRTDFNGIKSSDTAYRRAKNNIRKMFKAHEKTVETGLLISERNAQDIHANTRILKL